MDLKNRIEIYFFLITSCKNIFLTTEGRTFSPNSESAEPDIENLQVIGFSDGNDEKEAFDGLIHENPYLLGTAFDELICIEVKGGLESAPRFHISEKRGFASGFH